MATTDEIIKEAVGKGMYVVGEDDAEDLMDELSDILKEVDALCEINDPESEPYKSKYLAREKLNHFCNKLEANRTVASLEKKTEVKRDLDMRIAALQVRLGSIAWDCEEPHSCQIELDLAIVSVDICQVHK